MLRQVPGVGAITSLSFVLTLEDPDRFEKSRSVGAYLGLVPGKDQSGQSDPGRPISGEGDEMLRRLLVGSAHYILGPFGPDSDLRRHGEKIALRGAKNAKKRAVVAVSPVSSRCSFAQTLDNRRGVRPFTQRSIGGDPRGGGRLKDGM